MTRMLERLGGVALLAGGACYAIAAATIVFAPELLTDQSDSVVVGTDGLRRDPRPYTEAEQRGRDEYGRQVCWHCHSQFVRPWNDEDKRWGPVAQTGEYYFDVPHYFGTRRVGPDLLREGGLRNDDWHVAHFRDPRFTVPRSVMPSFPWLFEPNPERARVRDTLALLDTDGDGVVSPKFGDDLTTPDGDVARAREILPSLDRFGVRTNRAPGAPAAAHHRFHETPESGDGILTDYDGRDLLAPRGADLLAYVQSLGTRIGAWREPIPASAPPRTSPFEGAAPMPRRTAAMRAYGFLARDPARVKAAADLTADYQTRLGAWNAEHPALARRIADGRALYDKHCVGCHGAEGRGNGTAAPYLAIRPRDFTLGAYKFRSTQVGSLPHDGDLYRSIFRGLPGSAMPSWRELSVEQLWLLVDYVKSLYEGERRFNDPAGEVPIPPMRVEADWEPIVRRGRAVYLTMQCYNCHGIEGEADGPAWNTTTADYGNVLRARDLRPRLRDADAAPLYSLLGRHLSRLFGAEAFAKVATLPEWRDLAPTDDAKTQAFVDLLLGVSTQRKLRDVLGTDAVKAALGDAAYEAVFSKRPDPLEEIRLKVARDFDSPLLRFRGGADPRDVYRTIFTGITGTPMKDTFTDMWKRENVKSDATPDVSRRKAPFRFLFRDQDDAGGPNVKVLVRRAMSGDAAVNADGSTKEEPQLAVPAEPDLAHYGVTTRKITVEDGREIEQDVLSLRIGDDWALVYYVLWLACADLPSSGN